MNKILQARQAAGIATHGELAQILQDEEGIKLHSSVFSHYESGRVTPPTRVIVPLARVFRRRGVATNAEELSEC